MLCCSREGRDRDAARAEREGDPEEDFQDAQDALEELAEQEEEEEELEEVRRGRTWHTRVYVT